jgi:hypothetical protein
MIATFFVDTGFSLPQEENPGEYCKIVLESEFDSFDSLKRAHLGRSTTNALGIWASSIYGKDGSATPVSFCSVPVSISMP